jgi:leucyl aminopeptidase (aminopeptidase T)
LPRLKKFKYFISNKMKIKMEYPPFSSAGWHQWGTERQYSDYKFMELARAADFLCREVLKIKPGENVVLYCDTGSDMRVVNATAAAAHTLGAIPVIVRWYTQKDIDLPMPKAVRGAILNADVCIEFSACGYVHSPQWREAREAGVAMMCLVGMNADMMIRTLDPELYYKILEFGDHLRKVLSSAKSGFRITSPKGTDITMKVRSTAPAAPTRPPRGGMLVGQGYMPAIPESVNGTIVFDGSIWPPSEIQKIKEPIKLKVVDGWVKEISGGFEAKLLKNWFAHFNDPDVYKILHISPGFNPGVKRITGDIVEDERVFGCVEIGIGSSPKPCHTDGIILEPSIWVDDILIEEEGIYLEPTLKKLAREMGMQLWVE